MKALTTILLSTFKFGMTFPLAILGFHFGFFETLILTNTGGIIGIYFFAFLSEKIIRFWNRQFPGRSRKSEKAGNAVVRKRFFTRRNRRIVYIKGKYGLPGIAFVTPILLSIPVGVFIVVRYFRKRKYKLFYLFAANFLWSLIYATFYGFCYQTYLQFIAGS